MRYIHPNRWNRAGFTLVELLVVMLIIAILVSLVTAAVMKGIVAGSETQTRAEIGNMDLSLRNFMTDFNVTSVPSFFVLREDGNYTGNPPASAPFSSFYPATLAYLGKMYGKQFNPAIQIDWNGDGVISNQDIVLQGQECLVFFLGGLQTQPPNATCRGWPASWPANQAAALTMNLRPPYYEFPSSRLVPGGSNFLNFIDPWKGSRPYAFFSTFGTRNGYFATKRFLAAPAAGDCPTLLVVPYFHASGSAAVANFENPQTYQIISAGRDAIFGTGGLWDPTVGVRNASALGGGEDDQSNFSRTPLGNPQQQ